MQCDCSPGGGVHRMKGKRTLEDPHSGREVVDSAGRFQGSCDDGWRWNKIVREGIVQVAL